MNKSIKCTIFFIALLSCSVSYSQNDMLRPIVQNFMTLNNGKFQKKKTSVFFDTIVCDMKKRFKIEKCSFIDEFAVDMETGDYFRYSYGLGKNLEKLFEEIEGHSQSSSKIDSLFALFKKRENVDKVELLSEALYQVPSKYIFSQEENKYFLTAYENHCTSIFDAKEFRQIRNQIRKSCKLHRKFSCVVSFTQPIEYENYEITIAYLRKAIYRWVSYYLVYDKTSGEIYAAFRCGINHPF